MRRFGAPQPKDLPFAMRSDQKLIRARRARRRTLATVTVCASVALGAVATTGLSALPISAPNAASLSVWGVVPAALIASPASATASAMTIGGITADADTALGEARSVLAEVSSVRSETVTSELDLSAVDTSIDTAALRNATDRLADLELVPVLLLPALTEEAEAQADLVEGRVAEVRTGLEAARAQKAAEEAAAQAQAQAQREAEAAAAAAVAAEEQRQAEAAAAAAALANANTPAGAKSTAQQMAASQYGWGGDQFSCLSSLWQKESSWNYQAYNASSGATGIPQALPGSKMASAGSDWQTNASTQIAWGLQYIDSVYGSPCGAWGKSQSSGWY